jgi:hypothetical protein
MIHGTQDFVEIVQTSLAHFSFLIGCWQLLKNSVEAPATNDHTRRQPWQAHGAGLGDRSRVRTLATVG